METPFNQIEHEVLADRLRPLFPTLARLEIFARRKYGSRSKIARVFKQLERAARDLQNELDEDFCRVAMLDGSVYYRHQDQDVSPQTFELLESILHELVAEISQRMPASKGALSARRIAAAMSEANSLPLQRQTVVELALSGAEHQS
jgi:hypothetical protein